MSANASEPGPSTSVANSAAVEQKPLEQLGTLEEDDEFEGPFLLDWDESQTTLAVLTKQAQQQTNQAGGAGANGAAAVVGAQLWEDNWDDDDKEPPFVQQLRAELKSQNDADAMKL
ncbi:hypothetical protein FFLO_00400 [Filobasidium floriforme]|uniref:26S proteasome complex subunit SEM1 n=1 Tax=Filobasidium floriforme TaxID=5210 RepID=A0A8K0JS49_9TREE|nr:hypothetical protein FFLO_00400 [Filobasidium floriforme]